MNTSIILSAAAQWLSLICIAVAIAGCLYALAAASLVWRFVARKFPKSAGSPGVTILKPLHGSEPGLRACLATFCRQDYDGPIEIICGVQATDDAAIADVRELIAQFPDTDIKLVVDPREFGANRKVSNLINISQPMSHDVLVLSDSDISVEPDYLRRLVAALAEPGTGAVSCLYSGRSAGGLWSELAAMAIDQHFLPGVVVGLALGRGHPCFGSTIALHRQTLDRVGGLAQFADTLADDHALGLAVRRLGLVVAIPPFLVRHICSQARLSDLIGQELRWARTIASIDPAGFAGSGVTHAVPFALIGAALGGFSILSLGLVAAALACRAYLQIQVARAFGLAPPRLRLGPLRDVMSFLIYAASFFTNWIGWRGYRYRIGPDGTMTPQKG